MKFVVVVGARPQFVKAAVFSRAISERNDKHPENKVDEVIVHTGQHFDAAMSDSFFKDLSIPEPKYHLGLASLSHGAMTGRMIESIETVLVRESPDCVVVFGDTNSTLAAAISASKLHIPIAHIESGLRSNNQFMPEEINRILTDRISTFLFCSSSESIKNLEAEGYPMQMHGRQQSLYNFGDVMFDVVRLHKERSIARYPVSELGLSKNKYVLVTLHRPHLTDSLKNLASAFEALRVIAKEITVVIPLHPRVKAILDKNNLQCLLSGLMIFDPLPYEQMQSLLSSCHAVLTDSGGLQKEAMWHGKPCLTLREDTEWVETVSSGWNRLVGVNKEKILEGWSALERPESLDNSIYGNGNAAELIVGTLVQRFSNH
ncbi:UDP-N-acetylglucosamine 2-epimerase [gamma proteobacterium HIMB55]|nr:UDP-N-acetylglucosamine 2-epimerase [gamma proteobacterium HIMB55]